MSGSTDKDVIRFRFLCVSNLDGEAWYAISSQRLPAGTSHEELEEKIENDWSPNGHISCVKGDKTALVFYLPTSIFFHENAHPTNLSKDNEDTLSFAIDND